MAFIAIDAKADVAGSKKGKLTPAQHAQLNAWSLASKTGILDWKNASDENTMYRCEAKSYSISDGKVTVIFNKGYIVICGRLVECEQDTRVTFDAPISVTVTGSIILRFSLSNLGEGEGGEFEVTTKSGALTQQDLNDNPLTGVYEFELYSYLATPTTVTLTRTNTDYIQPVQTFLIGTGMVGTGAPPLQDYNKGEGTIEYRLGDIDTRLTALGFNEADISVAGISNALHLKRQGNYVIASWDSSNVKANISSSSWERGSKIFDLYGADPNKPNDFLPKTTGGIFVSFSANVSSVNTVYGVVVLINSSGEGRVEYIDQNPPSGQYTIYARIGYECNPRD